MECPNCQIALESSNCEDVSLEVCPTCRGLWLDAGRLRELLRRTTLASWETGAGGETKTPEEHAADAAIACPHCRQDMEPVNYAHDSGVMVQTCRQCSGFWLRPGQFQQLAAYREGTPAQQRLAAAISKDIARDNTWQKLFQAMQTWWIALGVAGGYLILVWLITRDALILFDTVRLFVVPLACIIFPNVVGWADRQQIGGGWRHSTPAVIVVLIGWLVLIVVIGRGLLAMLG